MPLTGRNICPRKPFQFRHRQAGYRTASWDSADLLTTSSSWLIESQSERRYSCLMIPNPPSIRQRACPGICIMYSIDWWRPVITRHIKYPRTYWFLFCPANMDKRIIFWCISVWFAAKAQASLCICTGSTDPSLLVYRKYGSR